VVSPDAVIFGGPPAVIFGGAVPFGDPLLQQLAPLAKAAPLDSQQSELLTSGIYHRPERYSSWRKTPNAADLYFHSCMETYPHLLEAMHCKMGKLNHAVGV
jgi:hypothetical protein